MKPSQLQILLTAAIERRRPVLVRGAPGVGKSDIVTRVAKNTGCDLIIMHPAVAQPTDARGMPALVSVTGPDGSSDVIAEFLPYGQLRALVNAERPTVCFIDDLGQASPAVQAAFMQLLLAREVGGHKVSEHVTFLSATNRRQDRAGVSGILEPVKSRFATIVQLDPDADEWAEWAAEKGLPFELGAYVQWRPEMLVGEPCQDIENTTSPRTLASAGEIMSAWGISDANLLAETLEGAAGRAFAAEFSAFVRRRERLPDPKACLLQPNTLDVPENLDIAAALVSALAQYVVKKTIPGFFSCMDRIEEVHGAEFAVLGMRMLKIRDKKLLSGPTYDAWCVNHADAIMGYIAPEPILAIAAE